MKFALGKFPNDLGYFLYYMHNNTHRWSGYFSDIQSCFKVPLEYYHTDPKSFVSFEAYIKALTNCNVLVFETDDIHTALDTHPELLI